MRWLSIFICLFCIACAACAPDDPWETIELGTSADFRDIFFLDSQNGWMVGSAGITVPGGIIGRTTDGGLTWKYRTGLAGKRYKAMSVDLNAVCFVDTMTGCIAAESGTILRSKDGGESWKRIRPVGPVYAHNMDIDFVDTENGWMIGRNGVVRTTDGGASWARVDEDGKMTGNAIDFIDLWRGWVVGKFGSVHHTDDGGVTWQKVEALGDLTGLTGDEIPTLTSVHFIDEETGWIAGYLRELSFAEQHDRAVIIHTSDGGLTWQHQISDVESLLKEIRFADRLRGWAVGYNINDGTSLVLHTEDGGQTWLTQTTVYGEELRALYVLDGQVWAVGKRAREEPQRLLRLLLPAGDGGSSSSQ